MAGFDSLHLFLDESGAIHENPARVEPLLVGGVVVFGKYDDESNSQLMKCLEVRVQELGGTFPNELHFGKSGLDFPRKQQLFQTLGSDLRNWASEVRAIHGVHLVHAGDVFPGAEGILGERHYDNRYLSMLWSLIEHLLFVDPTVSERLSSEATFHVHVASRAYHFDPRVIAADEVESLGWKVVPKTSQGRACAVNVVMQRDLVTMLRMALRQRWQRTPIRYGSVNVTRLDYEAATSPAGLYLADLYLGQARMRERARRGLPTTAIAADLVPTLHRLEYGPWLELLARMEAASRQGQIDPYLELADDYELLRSQHESSTLEPIIDRQRKALAGTLRAAPRNLFQIIEEGSRIVDQPGNADRGLAKALYGKDLLNHAGVEDLRSDVLLLQTRLSHANHMGDIHGAEAVWGEYQAMEPRLYVLGAEGLRLTCELRNRRAVNLTDQFQYDEAERVLGEIISERENWARDLAHRFKLACEQVPLVELGACFGTLGQVHALRGSAGDDERAEACFRRAMSLFDKAPDMLRQWVYLGHLACDRGERGRGLWQEVLERNSELQATSGSQYLVAIQLKGFLVFGPPENTVPFLRNWEASGVLDRFTAEEREHHPFGLIHQTLGMLYGRAWRETGEADYVDKAMRQFDRAHAIMARRGALLKVLAYAARLRKYVFLDEARGLGTNARSSLMQTLLGLQGHLAEHFGPTVWSEDEQGQATGFFGRLAPGPRHSPVDRARGILQAIRFNYT